MKKTKLNLRKTKLGQVSLEFLTTYGWAFMVALIAIGALAYFGVLNPSKYTPARCTFGTEITCNDHRISVNGAVPPVPTINFKLTNNVGASVRIDDINITNAASTRLVCPIAAILNGATAFNSSIWNDGSVVDLVATCSANAGNGINKGDKTKVQVRIRYYDPASGISYSHIVNGEIYDQVQ